MGQWGVRSYEGDEAADALDAAFERVHGSVYEELMDDRNPLTFEQVQQRLAGPETLGAAVAALRESAGTALDRWDPEQRLAFAGVVVRHAELGVPVLADWLQLAIDWLEHEGIEWEEATARELRRRKELDLLRRLSSGKAG